MQYVDDVISFDLPEHLAIANVQKPSIGVWLVEVPDEIYSVRIDFGFQYKIQIQSASSYGNSSGFKVHVDGPHQIDIAGSEAYYRILFGEVQGSKCREYNPSCMLTICKEDYTITVEINEKRHVKSRSFPMDKYLPSISSIKVLDLEILRHIHQNQLEKNQKKFSKSIRSKIRCDTPPGFDGVEPIVSAGRVKYQKDGMCIQVYNWSGLGQEVDDSQLNGDMSDGLEDATITLFPIQEKKCIVQNMSDEAIDTKKCRCITVQLSFQEQSYGIIFSSESDFDLEEYKSFLDSIGKMKK